MNTTTTTAATRELITAVGELLELKLRPATKFKDADEVNTLCGSAWDRLIAAYAEATK